MPNIEASSFRSHKPNNKVIQIIQTQPHQEKEAPLYTSIREAGLGGDNIEGKKSLITNESQ